MPGPNETARRDCVHLLCRVILALLIGLGTVVPPAAADIRVDGWLRAAIEVSRSGRNPGPLAIAEGEGERLEAGIQLRFDRNFGRIFLRCEGLLFARRLEGTVLDSLEDDEPLRLANCGLDLPGGWSLTIGRYRSPLGLLNDRWRSGIDLGTFWPPVDFYSLFDGPELDGVLLEYERGWFRSQLAFGDSRRDFSLLPSPQGNTELLKAEDSDIWIGQIWADIGEHLTVGAGVTSYSRVPDNQFEEYLASFEVRLNVQGLDSLTFRIEGKHGINEISAVASPFGVSQRNLRDTSYVQSQIGRGAWHFSVRLEKASSQIGSTPLFDEVRIKLRDEINISVGRNFQVKKNQLNTLLEWHFMEGDSFALIPAPEPGRLLWLTDQDTADYGLLSLSYFF